MIDADGRVEQERVIARNDPKLAGSKMTRRGTSSPIGTCPDRHFFIAVRHSRWSAAMVTDYLLRLGLYLRLAAIEQIGFLNKVVADYRGAVQTPLLGNQLPSRWQTFPQGGVEVRGFTSAESCTLNSSTKWPRGRRDRRPWAAALAFVRSMENAVDHAETRSLRGAALVRKAQGRPNSRLVGGSLSADRAS